MARPCQGQGSAWQSLAKQRPAVGQAPGTGAGRSAWKCEPLPPPAREAAERNNNGFQRQHLDMSSTAGGPRARGETRKNHGPAVLARAWLARAAAARGVAMHRAVKALIIPICGSCICNDYRICGGGARAGAKPLCPARPDKSQLKQREGRRPMSHALCCLRCGAGGRILLQHTPPAQNSSSCISLSSAASESRMRASRSLK